jgi:prolyl-tRNA synthetase
MGMSVLNADGGRTVPVMGCYGIGVGRALASVVEESNDGKGLIFPYSIAPFTVHLAAIKNDDAEIAEYAEGLYNELKRAGVEVLYDDRFASAGVKLSDADLMGMPIRLVVSPKMLALNSVEFKERTQNDAETVGRDGIIKFVKDKIALRLKELSE